MVVFMSAYQKPLALLIDQLCEKSAILPVVEILHVANNSRDIVKGSLFLAYHGEKSDGRHYIADAIAQGAVAICYEPSDDFILPLTVIPCVAIKNLKTKQSTIAARFYDFPSAKVSVIGVTGTNGKTSITHFIAQCLAHCGVIGTIGYGSLSSLIKTENTTPDGLKIQKIMAELIDQKIKTIAMEVSSHALSQQRVNDVLFHTGVFTNLTQDHLDFHGSMDTYRDAKALLFQRPNLKHAVINIDDAAGKFFVERYCSHIDLLTYSLHDKQADLFVEKYTPTQAGFDVVVKSPWGSGAFHLSLIGEFNIYNVLAVLGVLGIFKMPFEKILHQLSQLKTVDGRMQLLRRENKPAVVVDFAHTPDALEKALQSLRTHCDGKLICIFGCGGDRDKTKRSIMGKIAEQYADYVIITNDNPRSENPEAIARDILQEVKSKNKFEVELDRVMAIQKAIQLAKKADWILVAGKGHETEQIIGNKKWHHHDADCVTALLDAELR
ncbi:MAG: UDP-N-acetylmuramoyl-L-alanyl-D-glutamate--2,6-diaminopimelate ligase [Gammaproteobacteria bacterium CG_4_10_14_0_8_um_filter_38_16]|nr:MAG: UDP-N-acetylmuramoyl-L-alanyl-D-glutamate--2,6-diaminopimelate ligase [Gammaproteobacteria bacterium CG_4_10_14_0_8_um_filter_38_16]PJA03799.1 MAG: UDP-N-acetylmuramoyl-L-alanyl-D-glutamate--2,6-diaminopimelate ligase [Gammaproteobacteria bacterium CG_4_10_14_0_2_um_filter_38_22]PJB10773.1 MAG: UDP-N-acetylmuramoyl-L-alanyl-D-glutamate--2,6-diaminopimelate ligase [Gammaproteobacteria bacterium CG_4_9_14_3_um_filter_38_9]